MNILTETERKQLSALKQSINTTTDFQTLPDEDATNIADWTACLLNALDAFGSEYFVVSGIGMLKSGKSTLVNLLARNRNASPTGFGFDTTLRPALITCTPEPEKLSYPVLLNGAVPVLRTYPKATVIAEKTHAMVIRGEQNSRMKDFADLYMISEEFEFAYQILRVAMVKTFERRGTSLPVACPDCFSETFAMSEVKQVQWSAFLRKNSLNQLPAEFPQIVNRLSVFLLPVLIEQHIMPIQWHPQEGWISK